MSHYFPEYEPKSERLFQLTVESSYGFGHVTARVVRRAIPDHTDPDTGKVIYNDGTTDVVGIRGATWSNSNNKTALYVDGLIVRNQFDTEKNDPSYGHHVQFINVHHIELSDAKKILKTLDTINKKLEKFSKEFGYAEDFTTILIRTAKILGIKRFIIGKYKNTAYISNEWSEFGPEELKYKVTKLEDSVRTNKPVV